MTVVARTAAGRAGALVRLARIALMALLLIGAQGAGRPAAAADPAEPPERALQSALAEARAAATGPCPAIADNLARVLCTGTLRVGVRSNYLLFGFLDEGKRSGYEVAVAARIAEKLGVTPSLITVSPANRLASLAEGQVDLVIATMGHTTARDREVLFVRPHYYISNTMLIGPPDLDLPNFDSLAGHSVCIPVGTASSTQLAAHGARLLMFDGPTQILDQLDAEECTLAAHDDTFLGPALVGPRFAGRLAEKFRFAPLPWGMAVAKKGGDSLVRALSLMNEVMHRDGDFMAIAAANKIDLTFLRAQQQLWSTDACNRADGFSNPACVMPPQPSDTAQTWFAGWATSAESFLAQRLHIHVSLDILKLQPAWDLLREGIINTLILIVGALVMTLLFAVVIGQALSRRAAFIRVPARTMVLALQSSPLVLSLTIGAAVMNTLASFSSESALATAMIVIGLANGANAGHAIGDVMATLRAEGRADRGMFLAALRRAGTQIIAFLINAAKSSPVASLIGAPEVLNAVSDSGSFTSDRITLYWFLLIFYILLVLATSNLCRALLRLTDQRAAA